MAETGKTMFKFWRVANWILPVTTPIKMVTYDDEEDKINVVFQYKDNDYRTLSFTPNNNCADDILQYCMAYLNYPDSCTLEWQSQWWSE